MEDASLQELFDREAIKEVRAYVAQALDYRDWPLFDSLFTEEVYADFTAYGIPAQTIPRTALRQSYADNLRREGLRTQHLFTNFRITVRGDTAECVSQFVGQHFLSGAAGGEEFVLHGEYRDQLTRTEDGWKIAATAFILFYTSGNPALLASS